MEDTWASRDLPVLDAIVRWKDAHPIEPGPSYQVLVDESGMDLDTVTRSVASLEGSFVEVHKVMARGFTGQWRVTSIDPRARQIVGQWPSAEAYTDRLIHVLEQSAEAEPEGSAARSKLRATASAITNLGRDVMVEVTAKVIGNQMGV